MRVILVILILGVTVYVGVTLAQMFQEYAAQLTAQLSSYGAF